MSIQFLGLVALERFVAAERYRQAHHEPSATAAGPSKRAGQASAPHVGGPPGTSGKPR